MVPWICVPAVPRRSDVSAIRTKAVRVKGEAGGDYVIKGQKMWLTNGGTSNLVAVPCRTDALGARQTDH